LGLKGLLKQRRPCKYRVFSEAINLEMAFAIGLPPGKLYEISTNKYTSKKQKFKARNDVFCNRFHFINLYRPVRSNSSGLGKDKDYDKKESRFKGGFV
jgi:hypothetical protein